MPPLHTFYPHQEHPLQKKEKTCTSPPPQPKNKTKQTKKKKMGWEGELILQILPRRNSLDERECRSRSLTVQTSPDRVKRHDTTRIKYNGLGLSTINIHKILNSNGASEALLEYISVQILTALFCLKGSLLTKTLFINNK